MFLLHSVDDADQTYHNHETTQQTDDEADLADHELASGEDGDRSRGDAGDHAHPDGAAGGVAQRKDLKKVEITQHDYVQPRYERRERERGASQPDGDAPSAIHLMPAAYTGRASVCRRRRRCGFLMCCWRLSIHASLSDEGGQTGQTAARNARSAIVTGVAAAQDLPILELPDGSEWARWLGANHARSTGIWLKIAKKGSPIATVTQAEAIDEAVCFGWIDGQLDRHDEHFFLQRFTPRRPRSRWSAVNRERARRLIAEGRMKPAGLAEYQAAEADGRLDDAYAPQSKATVPEDFRIALHEHPEAKQFFETLGSTERYKFLYRLHHTKDPKRRAERIADYIELLSQRKILARD